ncbi:MAG: hypothetical protein J2P36_24975, partial [Ktedonobacteraceae bacterium]|nr:hypothetical protein [Ktedonobacteraceae bacterium]
MSPLRVLIIGQQNNFGRVLAANIQQWGHEAVALPSAMMDDVDEVGGRSGDIVLCDLDEPFYQGLAASFPGGGMTADMQHYLAIS